MGLAEHTVPPFLARASDSNAGCDSGWACSEPAVVRKRSGAAVVLLQVISQINGHVNPRDPTHREIASRGRRTSAGPCHRSCETSFLELRQQTLVVNINLSSFPSSKVSPCGDEGKESLYAPHLRTCTMLDPDSTRELTRYRIPSAWVNRPNYPSFLT